MNHKSYLMLLLLAMQGVYADAIISTTSHTLEDIKQSYQNKAYEQTITQSKEYLSAFPNDVDVSLYEGLAYQRLNQCSNAEPVFEAILAKNPNYADARTGLIQCYFKTKSYKKALEASEKGLVLDPKNAEFTYYKAKSLTLTGHKTKSQQTLKALIAEHPEHTEAQQLLGNLRKEQKLATEHAPKKTTKVESKPIVTPKRIHYGRTFFTNRNIPLSSEEFAPNYVAGVYTDNMFVNTPNQFWNLSNLYAYKITPLGSFGASVNYTERYNNQALQLELNAIPKLTKSLYFDLAYAYSDTPQLFPTHLERAEAYLLLPNETEVSLGGAHREIAQFRLESATGSIGKYIGRYYLNFRPTHFTPGSGPTSIFYKLGLRRYGDDPRQYVGVVLGDGYSPDLTDLLTVDFIKVRNRLAFFEGQQPINQNFAFQYGVGYEDLRYPNNLLRTLVHINLGIKMGFI